jgi:FMN hydrolase / 5-amino-6-(5-phospho-D-ribitylamino)uracil phosphatase
MRGKNSELAAIVTFDPDGTLCDFQRLMAAALTAALFELQRLVPGERTAALTREDLRLTRDQVAVDPSGQGLTMEQIRLAAFTRTLEQIGQPDPAFAAHLLDVYMARRFGQVALYPDVVPMLNAFGSRYRLGLVSNGNSYPERSGLGARFAFTVFAHDHGVQKPDRRFYEIVLATAGVAAHEVIHVGDPLVNDVGGAQAVGMRTVWLNRHGQPLDPSVRPDAAITTLADLASVLNALEVRA